VIFCGQLHHCRLYLRFCLLLVIWFAEAEDIYRIKLIPNVIVREMIGVNGGIRVIGTDTVLRAMLIACVLADDVPAAGGDETLEAT